MSTARCGGKRVIVDRALLPGNQILPELTMRRCLRCNCTSAYRTDEDRDCPVLREPSSWTPRESSDGSWNSDE